MKIYKLIIGALTTIIIFAACQKELTFDENGVSIGTFKKDAVGDCLPVTVNGFFYVDTVLSNASYVDVEINASSGGSFDIKSDTVNGYSFSKTGSVGTGSFVVRLYPSGKPLAAGTNTFTVTYGTSTCTFDITVTTGGGGGGGGTAVYTLGGAPGNCTGVVLSGTYMAGLPTTASNTAQIDVTVTTVGTYNLTTPFVNGVQFSKTGSFTTTGAQTVTLTATDTPLVAGTFIYPVSGGGSTCEFAVTYVAAAPPAVFTFTGGPGNCVPPIVNGNYAVGVALNASNSVEVDVDVTVAGTYTISTNTVNGMTFSKSGLFTTTGSQSVTLNGTGSPLTETTSTFTPMSGSTSCTFDITVDPAPGILTCKVNGVFTTFNEGALALLVPNPPGEALFLNGSVSASSSEALSIALAKTNGPITAGTYTQASGPTVAIVTNYTDAGGAMWVGFSAFGTPFTIVITSITATRVIGTFSGTVKDGNGTGPNSKLLTEGVFNLPL